jgi:hypothetical protein
VVSINFDVLPKSGVTSDVSAVIKDNAGSVIEILSLVNTGGNYSASWTSYEGLYVLEVTASNSKGGSEMSQRDLTIDAVSNHVDILSPVQDEVIDEPAAIVIEVDVLNPIVDKVYVEFKSPSGEIRYIKVDGPDYILSVMPEEGNGIYEITVSARDQSGVTLERELVSFEVTGIPGTVNALGSSLDDFKVELFPVPARETVNINLSSKSISSVELFGVNGGIIASKVYSGGSENVQFDLSNVSAGIYVIKVYSGQEVSVNKIVVE